MFILTVKGYEEDGAFSLEGKTGDKVLLMFEEEDDATRYALELVDNDYPEMLVVEVDDDAAVNACEMNNYEYNLIKPEDIIVPPKDDLFSKNSLA